MYPKMNDVIWWMMPTYHLKISDLSIVMIIFTYTSVTSHRYLKRAKNRKFAPTLPAKSPFPDQSLHRLMIGYPKPTNNHCNMTSIITYGRDENVIEKGLVTLGGLHAWCNDFFYFPWFPVILPSTTHPVGNRTNQIKFRDWRSNVWI